MYISRGYEELVLGLDGSIGGLGTACVSYYLDTQVCIEAIDIS